MTLAPYPEFKDSGVEWLGDIPAHWEVKKVKRLFQHKKQLNSLRENTNVLSLTLRGVVNNDPDSPEGLVPKDYATYQIFEKDDLVFKLIDLENLRTSRVGLVHKNGIMSSAYVRLILQTSDKIRYFYYQFYDLYLRGVYNNLGAGVRSTLGQNDLLNLPIFVPPIDEQVAIVRFLDAAETRIRRYIRAKQKLVKLLNEQKQAIIQQAVTRGLDPNVPMKDSGVEWLGEIPAHWEEKPAKYFYREIDIRSTTGEEELLSVSHITGVTPRSQKNITMFKAASYVGSKLCETGDLVINTMWAWMGAMGVSRQTGIVSPSYGVYRPLNEDNFLPDFTDYLLRIQPYISEYICRSTGIRSSRLRLYPDEFLSIPILRPPVDEQQAILDYVESETSTVNHYLSNAEKEIDLIREYRTRLIADVVTGKVDVRGLAFEMPEAFDEDDLLDVDEDALFEEDELEEMSDGED